MLHLKTILHPTDLSDGSRTALEIACALARDQAARMILLHVVPRPPQVGRDADVPAFKEEHAGADLEAYRGEMADRLQRLREEAPYARLEAVLAEGDAAGVILRTAAETGCDLIVLGARGRSRPGQTLLGDVAAEVTRAAPCPVVTVAGPPPAGERGAGRKG
jgi:nucleotide-binding universal stress UspA family protein